jgi:acarbose 7IV-phosphotransferase
MSVIVRGGTGIDTIVPVAGLVVDPNGAGDAFAAAFLAACLTGASDDDCLRWATLAGAFACTRAVGANSFIMRATLLDRRG